MTVIDVSICIVDISVAVVESISIIEIISIVTIVVEIFSVEIQIQPNCLTLFYIP